MRRRGTGPARPRRATLGAVPNVPEPHRADPAARRMAGRLVAVALCCAVAVGVLYVLAVRTERGQLVDDAALAGQQVERPGVGDDAEGALAAVTEPVLAVATLGLAALALMARRPRLAVGVGVAVAGAVATSEVLKGLALERPALVEDPVTHAANSFPSGHATVATALGLGLLLVAPRWARGLVALLGAAFVAAVGTGVLAVAWHRPSDVVAGQLVAAGWCAGVAAWLALRRGVSPPASRAPRTPPVLTATVALVGAAGVVLGVAGAALVGRDVLRGLRDPATLRNAYEVGRILALGTGVAAVGATALVLRGVELDAPRERLGVAVRRLAARVEEPAGV